MEKEQKNILWFKEVGIGDITLVGGKNASLGEMIQQLTPKGINIPDGFATTAKAYFDFLEKAGIKEKIKEILRDIDVSDIKNLQEKGRAVRALIARSHLPEDLEKEISDAYSLMSREYGEKQTDVAVRSSATAEDLPNASFAGQQETYLNVRGDASLLVHIRRAWASLFEPRAIYYRHTQGFDHAKVGLAVPIQLMVQSDYSGIMFTVNPLTNSKEEVSIEAAFGLGQPVVSGEVTPDQYIVNKKSGKITSRYLAKQTWQLTLAGNTPISKKYQQVQKLTNKQIVELAQIGIKIEEHYKRPQDIEYGIEDGRIFIVQSRPVTTLIQKETEIGIDGDKKI